MEAFNYRYYSYDQLEIDSIDTRLLSEEKLIRRYLMDYVIDNGQAFQMKDSSKIVNDIKTVDRKEVAEILDNLLKKNAIVADGGNINFIYPVSAVPTDHRVKLADGRKFSAMCAIDAIGSAFTFKQDVNVDSECSYCGEEVKLSIINGKLNTYKPSDLHVLHVDLNKNSDWSGDC